MNKPLLLLIALWSVSFWSYSQTSELEVETSDSSSSFQKFMNLDEGFISYRDYQLKGLRSSAIGSYTVMIRDTEVAHEVRHKFLVLKMVYNNSTYSGAISELKLKETYEAFIQLRQEAERMKMEKVDYFESKYKVDADFSIGYALTANSTQPIWFIRIGFNRMIRPRNAEVIDEMFKEAMEKIRGLRGGK